MPFILWSYLVVKDHATRNILQLLYTALQNTGVGQRVNKNNIEAASRYPITGNTIVTKNIMKFPSNKIIIFFSVYFTCAQEKVFYIQKNHITVTS